MLTDSLTQKQGHLAWCALIALHLARKDGEVHSSAQENLFLTRWLSDALKQHRFSRDVAPEIAWLVKQGRTLGLRANLHQKIDYLWRSCTGELLKQNDLFRLTYSLEKAKDLSWHYYLLSDREWSGRNAIKTDLCFNAIFISRTSLDAAFNDAGMQIQPLIAKVNGDYCQMDEILRQSGWHSKRSPDNNQSFRYELYSSCSSAFPPGRGSDVNSAREERHIPPVIDKIRQDSYVK